MTANTGGHAPTAPSPGSLREVIEASIGAPISAVATPVSTVARGVVLYEGDAVDGLYLVQQGIFRADVAGRLSSVIEVGRFGPGDYFGEMAFLQGEPASATIRAVTAGICWRIPHAALESLVEQHPAIAATFARGLAARLGVTNRRLSNVRPGRLAFVTMDDPAVGPFLAHVVQSSSRHLGGANVVILDLTGRLSFPMADSLPSVSDLIETPGPAITFARGGGSRTGVAVGTPQDAASSGLNALTAELHRHAGLVLVVGPVELSSRFAESHDADRHLRLCVNDEPAVGVDTEVINLRFDGKMTTPGALQARRAAGLPAPLRVVPSCQALEGQDPGRPAPEPWISVDWTARHLLGLKVGLALGAGASRAYAHLGVIEELQRLGVPFDFVGGTVLGAAIANALTWGVGMRDVQRMMDTGLAPAFRFTFPLHSFFTSRVVKTLIYRYNRRLKFEHMPIPLSIIAVDLDRRADVVLQSGFVAPAIVASMAIPGLFPPVRLGGRTLVEGGLLNPMPISVVSAAGADVVIGVKLSAASETMPAHRGRRIASLTPPIVDTIQQAFSLMQWRIVGQSSSVADISIEPAFTGRSGLRDFDRGPEFVEAGRAAVAAAANDIRRSLPWLP